MKDGCCEADVGLKPNARRQGEERSGRVSGHTGTALLALVASGQGHGLRAGGVHTVDTVYRRRSCARRRIRMRQGLLKHVTPKNLERISILLLSACVCYYNYQKPNLELLLRSQGVSARLRFPMYTLSMNTVENCYVWMRIVETRIVCITSALHSCRGVLAACCEPFP